MSDFDKLVAGYPALAALDRHVTEEECPECMRFAGRLFLGDAPKNVLHLRCEQARRWQATVDEALEIVKANT